jgi:hypothetical protein
MDNFEFDLSDLEINELLVGNKDDIQIVAEVEQKLELKPTRVINRVSEMNDVDKMLVERIIRFNPLRWGMIDDSNYDKVVEQVPNTKIIDLLKEYVGLSEVLAYNFVTRHRYNLCVNPHFHIFEIKKHSTFTKNSCKHLFSR